MQEAWIAYAAHAGLTFEQMIEGHKIVSEDPEYYGRVGFGGLVASLTPDTRSEREKALDAIRVGVKRY